MERREDLQRKTAHVHTSTDPRDPPGAAAHVPHEGDDLPLQELSAIERRTQELGRFLFNHRRPEQTHLLERRWWADRVMAWAMEDEALKVQLFRFVDVLPMLHDSDAVIEHLSEYLEEVQDRLPSAARVALGVARRTPMTRAAVARAAKLAAMDFARRFIAGENTAQVLAAVRRERTRRRAFTLDILGEAVISEAEAERFFQAYVSLIENVAPTVNQWPDEPLIDRDSSGAIPRMNLSIKLSALDAHFDAIDSAGVLDRVGPRLRELLRIAARHKAFLNVDMESYDKKDLTLWLFQTVLQEKEFRDVVDIGIVIQCYLHDAAHDLAKLRDWAKQRGAPVCVRLVKGAYWDYETAHAQAEGWPVPVFTQKWRSDENFERQTRFLLRNSQFLKAALGSHNLRSIAHGIAAAEHFGLPKSALELQMLYGMGDAEKQTLVGLGHRLRIYMPYGDLIPGMAYLVRRLLENTSNDSFVRAGFDVRVSRDELLKNPSAIGRTAEPGARERSPNSGHEVPVPGGASAAIPGGAKMEIEPLAGMQAAVAAFRNQPQIDFSRAENRQAMTDALAAVRQEFGAYYPLVIGGEKVETNERLASLNPSQFDEVVGVVSMAEARHVDEAVAAAAAAQQSWKRTAASERADVLRRAAQIMRERQLELAAWQVFECAKGWREATADVCEAIDFCEFYALAAEALFRRHGKNVPGEENRFEHLPRGVAAIISPWNFPLAILAGMSSAALVCGNAVVLKPAEQSSVTAALWMEILSEAGLPPGVANFLPGEGETVGAGLVTHPDVSLIAFTGSQAVGMAINISAAQASARIGKGVKRVIAEMGGKNAILVDADADLDEAVLGVLKSAFGYQGQKCSACSRAIVVDAVHDAFLERLAGAARALSIGPAEDPASQVGPVIDSDSLVKIQQYIEIGKREATTVLAVDVGDWARCGYFVGPHIFSDVTVDSRLAQEEIFGPVLSVIRAADLSQAIEFGNATAFGLTGGVYSRSPANLARVEQELMVGNLYLNRGITGALVGRQPFGGFKMSGIGSKAGGAEYLLQFVIPRTVTENTMRRGFAPPTES